MDRVLVAMSGGVDSSVALLKVIEMGYEAVGVTMKLWEYKDVGGNTQSDSNCCSIDSINAAKIVCDQLGVRHYTLDFTDTFKEKVVDDFADEYLKGRTPNPCVKCNSHLKWDTFISQAKKLNARYIATGHYAQIKNNRICKGIDPAKDQSYVLWGIPKETIDMTLFPLGGLTKQEVRDIASAHELITANTPESMDICFVADNNYKRFLSSYRKEQFESIGTGDLLNESGDTIGKHQGYHSFTVGQRKGIGLSNPNPLYVKKIDADKNSVVVSEKKSLLSSTCYTKNINWLISTPQTPLSVDAQIRYNSKASRADITRLEKGYKIEFHNPQLAITPGQSLALYDGDSLIGGGIIETS